MTTFGRSFASYRATKATICAATRQLIDTAIAAGKVTQIPVGVSGLPSPVWDNERSRIVDTKLINPNLHAYNKGRLNAQKHFQKQAALRRAEIAEMLSRGLHYKEIANLRGEGLESTRKICHEVKRGLVVDEPTNKT